MGLGCALGLAASPVPAGDYAALDGVNRIKVVFDVTQGSPQVANVVFWAVRNVQDDASVRALQEPPQVAIVGNGFISVVGYQAKGYAVVTIN